MILVASSRLRGLGGFGSAAAVTTDGSAAPNDISGSPEVMTAEVIMRELFKEKLKRR
jgi:hypothetical protein